MNYMKITPELFEFMGSSYKLRVENCLANDKVTCLELLEEVYDFFRTINELNSINFIWRAEDFYPPDEWSKFTKRYRIAIGLCIAFLANQRLIPMERINKGKSGTAKYRILPTLTCV